METQVDGRAEPLEQIQRAFHEDDAAGVRLLIDQYPEFKGLVNEPIGPFDSPAICNVKSRAMLDVLLDAGADINARSKWWAGGFGLLDSADPKLAAYAVTRGAAMTIHAASRLGMVETVREMILRDPQLVHARGGDGQTPLHFASTVEIAELLLNAGADINAKDLDHESTPAMWMLDERKDVARYLVSRGCKTDLLMAAALGDVDLARRILDEDPDKIRLTVSGEYFPMINPRSGGTMYQWTLGWYVRAHQVARKFGHNDVRTLLVERSPAPVKLIDACWQKDEATAKKLISEGASGDLTEEDRRHVAHAARNNETAVVRLMLEAGLPVTATSQHKGMPLHWAAFHGNTEMTRNILHYNPPMDVRDADHNAKPIGWAIYGSENGWYSRSGDYAGTVEALLEAGADLPEELVGSPAVREVLKRHGVQ